MVKTEILLPPPAGGSWRKHLANLDDYARKIEENLSESLDDDDVVRAIPRLALPDLADFSILEVIEGDRCVRSAFAHRDPSSSAAVKGLIDHRAELRHFPEQLRALAAEPF